MYYLNTHIRISSAFLFREMSTRFGRNPGGYIWALIEPLAFIGLMTALFQIISHTPPMGESYPLFYATGYFGFHIYSDMQNYIKSSLTANKSLLSYPIVAPVDIVTARFILQAITTTVVCIIILGIIIATLRFGINIYWPALLQAAFFGWLFGLGLGLINIVLFPKYPLYEKVFMIISRPFFLLSGAFYIPSSLPHPAGDIILMNPLCHLVLAFREGFYGPASVPGLDMSYLAKISLSLFFIGTIMFTVSKSVRDRR